MRRSEVKIREFFPVGRAPDLISRLEDPAHRLDDPVRSDLAKGRDVARALAEHLKARDGAVGKHLLELVLQERIDLLREQHRLRLAEVRQEIEGHAQPCVLHGHQRTQPRECRGSRALGGHFFIGRPFGMDVHAPSGLGEIFDDLRGGGSRIPGGELNPRLQRPPCDGLVSHDKLCFVLRFSIP
jgi:hypothetical protein